MTSQVKGQRAVSAIGDFVLDMLLVDQPLGDGRLCTSRGRVHESTGILGNRSTMRWRASDRRTASEMNGS